MEAPQIATAFVVLVAAGIVLCSPVNQRSATDRITPELSLTALQENVTALWNTLIELQNRLDFVEREDRIHHHHHHYHHYYDPNATDHNETNFNYENYMTGNHALELNHNLQDDNNGQSSSSNDPNPTVGHNHHHHHHILHPHHPPDNTVYISRSSHCENGNGDDDDDEEVSAKALCAVRPNRALPSNERQNIRGIAIFKQKNTNLEVTLKLHGFLTSIAHVSQTHPDQPHDHGFRVHGFHVHEFGDISNGCESAGSHYNPLGKIHGGPNSTKRHIGDFGNIECDKHGRVVVKFVDTVASLRGPHSIIGKTLVIHESGDDFGRNPSDLGSITTGNAGRRLACCVITKQDIQKH